MNILKTPTKKEALQLIVDNWDDVYASTQGQNIINEIHLCGHFGLKYVDMNGFDGVDKENGEKIELKTTDARTCGRAQWNSCGSNKALADWFIFWCKITGQWAKVSNSQVQKNVNASGGIKARLSDNPGGRSKRMKTSSSWFK